MVLKLHSTDKIDELSTLSTVIALVAIISNEKRAFNYTLLQLAFKEFFYENIIFTY